MARALTLGQKSLQRVGRMLQDWEGAPLQAIRRRAKWPIAGGNGLKPYIVTTKNCALDGFLLSVGTSLDDDSRQYVECKPVTDTAAGTVDDEADPVNLYCDTATRGFLAYGLVVMAGRIRGKLTTRHGLELAHGLWVSGGLAGETINLFADGEGNPDFEVEVNAENGCDNSEGPSTVDQIVRIEWEWRPGENGGASRLVVADWCCPP